jgi:hypothetical protein
MNIEILTVEEPPATLCAFVQEADTFVERLGRLILAVNREFYARQTSLSRFGDCGLNERLAYPLPLSSATTPMPRTPTCDRIWPLSWQNIAPAQHLVISTATKSVCPLRTMLR